MLLVALSMVMLATLTASVQAGFIGDVPIIPIKRQSDDYNMIVGVGVENLWLNKGLVKLGENDRAIIVVSVVAVDPGLGGIGVVAGIDPKDYPATADKEAELRTGAYVKVLPILISVPTAAGEAIKAVISDGKTVLIFEVTIQLVVVDVRGGRHVLDTVVVTQEFKGGLPPEVPS